MGKKCNLFLLKVANGVKQCRILSPSLSLYTDDFGLELINCNIGCHLGGKCLKHIVYTDDLCLLSVSSNGMQKLLNIHKCYTSYRAIIYRCQQRITVLFKPRIYNNSNPFLRFCNGDLQYV
jgi:hypothetical protein